MGSLLFVNIQNSLHDKLESILKEILNNCKIYKVISINEAIEVSRNNSINMIFFDLDEFENSITINFTTRLELHIVTHLIPVLFLTKADGKELLAKTHGLRGYDFMHKSISNDMLLLKLSKYKKHFKSISGPETIIDDSIIYTETDTNGIITKVSKKFEEVSGYSKKELIGKPHNIVRHPSMPKKAFKDAWAIIQKGSIWEGIIKNRKKDGSSYIVKATIYPIKREDEMIIGYASARQDITKEMIEKQRNKKILDAQYALIVIANDKEVVYINKTLFHFYNFKDLADFKSKHKCICDLFEPYNEEAIMPKMNDDMYWIDYIKQRNTEENFVYITDKNDNLHIYDVRYRGNITASQKILVFTDVTQIQKQSQILQEQSRFAAMGEMIGMIAHQWRQPLAAMKALMTKTNFKRELEQLDDATWNNSYEKHDELIQYMTQTIDDFKDFFKGSGEYKETTILDIINRPYRLVESLFEKNSVKFEKKFENENLKDEIISTITSKLDQVIMNLYKNALDIFIEKQIKNASIKIICFEDDRDIVFQICDNAGGIPNDIIGKIFDPYFSTKGDNGTGIGLYMSKIIIESHLKGKLEVSNKNNGACFSIKLPRAAILTQPSNKKTHGTKSA